MTPVMAVKVVQAAVGVGGWFVALLLAAVLLVQRRRRQQRDKREIDRLFLATDTSNEITAVGLVPSGPNKAGRPIQRHLPIVAE